ncbi:MAG: helix-turn-helix domain-containing protein [Chloroflexi bacterium]|nr:helix-turn-helix domain-containing protein [Chloroflexota bacterium]
MNPRTPAAKDRPGIRPGAVYTLGEACTLLHIGKTTARRWVQQGRLPRRKVGRTYRFLGRDLLAALAPQPAPGRESLDLTPFTPDHPLLKLSGAGDSGLSDLGQRHDAYLLETLADQKVHPRGRAGLP